MDPNVVFQNDVMKSWTFLTSHAHVLLAITSDPTARAMDIAESVGITQRAAQRIVADLEEAGYLTRAREGRRNRFTVNADAPMRHPINQDHELSALIAALSPTSSGR